MLFETMQKEIQYVGTICEFDLLAEVSFMTFGCV